MLQKRRKFRIFPEEFGYFPHIFLIYLVMPTYYISTEKSWKLVFGIVLLLTFLITYRQLYNVENRKAYTYWLLLQMTIIIILSAYFNIYNLFLGFFSAYFIGWYKTKKLFYQVLSLLAITLLIPLIIQWEAILKEELYIFGVFVLVMIISPFGIRSMNERMELEKRLDEANEQIKELVKRDERMRIARDLHDTLGHTLSMITLKSQLVHRLISMDKEKALHEAKEIEKTSRSALKQVRELVSDMRAITFAEELIETETILEAAGIHYQFEGDSKLEEVPLLTQNILSMCLKEGITNVVNHSQAKNCVIKMIKKAGEIELTIYDDGRGFDGKSKDGNGLKGIYERLRLIDGYININSTNGTKLIITIPIIIKEKKAGVGS